MRRISLNGQWQLAYAPQREGGPQSPTKLYALDWPTIPGAVPGNVELDLLAAGAIEDPSVGNRVYTLRKYETYEWWYRRVFPSPLFENGQRVELVFEGLDCFGTAWLNGALLGHTDNMFIAHRFDVTGRLRPGAENQIAVRIRSAVLEGRKHEVEPYESAFRTGAESLTVRKAPHMYGWDIMPRIVSAGLWRDVALEILEPTRWRSVYWAALKTNPVRRSATLLVIWNFVTDRLDVDGLRVRLTLRRHGQITHSSEYGVIGTHERHQIPLEDVELWRPRGHGEAALYDASLELLDENGATLDTHNSRVGLRTIELRRTDISTRGNPGQFVFVVNGDEVFVKGANWVPLDAFHSRDRLHLKEAFDMIVDLNCNMVRCWGGNVYEDHTFFDLCDENGVMVWQDFAFACQIYPQTDEFAAVVRREAEAVIRKLRNHPGLALWAGNNEIDSAFGWRGSLGLDPNTERLSREILPSVILRLDPLRPYLPSSPYHSPEVIRRGNQRELMPEVHLWGKRPYYKDAFYTETPAPFVSEIGYHGCPNRESLERMLDEDCLWPWQDNDQWLTKAVRPLREVANYNYRIPLMAKQIEYLFGRAPDNLDDFILASQIAQAEALKFFVEWWRQGKWRRSGILWWNLRDGWPIISDAIVDYYGSRKIAYDYLKRAQADICAICGEAVEGQHSLLVVNDTLKTVDGRVLVRDADDGGVLLESDFAAPANGVITVGRLPNPANQRLWLLEWTTGGAQYRNHYLAGKPPFQMDDYRRWLEKIR